MNRVVSMSQRDPGDALRTPPHNYEAERALLGAILMNNRTFEKVAEFLEPEHFADPVNARVFEVCKKLIDQGAHANVITLKGYFQGDQLITDAGGMKYLASLVAGVVTTINTEEYGRLIEDMWRRRQLIEIGQNLVNEAYDVDPDANAVAIQEGHEAALTNLSNGPQRKAGGSIVSLADALAETISAWEQSSREGEVGLSYSLPTLDALAGLMQDEEYIVLGARPSMGKTALARAIGCGAAAAFKRVAEAEGHPPKNVLFFSAEMGMKAQAGAVLTGLTGIPRPRRKDALSVMDIESLVVRSQQAADLPFLLDDTPAVTLSHMRSACRRVQRRPGGLGLIIVDYLQLMGLERGVRADNGVQAVTYLSKGLKELARQVKVPLIALSQLSRAVEQRENKRPHLSDLRESGAIEQDADVIMFLYRDQYYLERDPPQKRDSETLEQFNARSMAHQVRLEAAQNKAEVIVAKARLGSVGTVTLEFDGPRMAFTDPKSKDSSVFGPPPGHPASSQMDMELK